MSSQFEYVKVKQAKLGMVSRSDDEMSKAGRAKRGIAWQGSAMLRRAEFSRPEFG